MRQNRLTGLVVIVVTALIGVSLLPSVVPASQRAAAPTAEQVRFTTSGDFGTTAEATAVFSRIRTSGSDLHLAVGDLSYGQTGQEQAWCDRVLTGVGAGFPFHLISGNHEMDGLNGNINDFSACLPNQLPGLVGVYGREWYVDVPQTDPLVRFVMISPDLTFPGVGRFDYSAGSSRYNWTAAAIDGARGRSIPWVVVGVHKPCLSIGMYVCNPGPGVDIYNLLVSKKVDLVLNGHEHLYQRSKQLTLNAACPTLVPDGFDADCVADADNQLVKGAGTVMATVGTGGRPLRDVAPTTDSEAPYFTSWSGLNADPTWGSLAVTLTPDTMSATFDRAAGGTFSDSFVVSSAGPPANVPPTARIASSCTQLACTFDGTGSSDSDGSIATFAWTFGDGTSGSGPSVSHSYPGPGTYPVALTVTDDRGATHTATTSVTVTSSAGFGSDTFTRTVSGGWGSADVGGPWTISGGTANASVTGTRGALRIAAGSTITAGLNAAVSANTDLGVVLSPDKVANGNGLYVSVLGRRVSGAGDYRAKAKFTSTGTVLLSLVRTTSAGAETALAADVSTGVQFAAGDQVNVRLQVTGANPTTVRAKAWEVGTNEPAAWQRTASDSTAGLQTAGSVGVLGYLSSGATNGPIVLSVDDLLARTP